MSTLEHNWTIRDRHVGDCVACNKKFYMPESQGRSNPSNKTAHLCDKCKEEWEQEVQDIVEGMIEYDD